MRFLSGLGICTLAWLAQAAAAHVRKDVTSSASVASTSLQPTASQPACTAAIVHVQGSPYVAATEITQNITVVPTKSNLQPSVDIEYSTCGQPLMFKIKTWPTSYNGWDVNSNYSESIDCMLSGQPTNDTINLLLKNNAPFWQWFDGSQAADGLNMTCNHNAAGSAITANSTITIPSDCSAHTVSFELASSKKFYAMEDWTDEVLLFTGGPQSITLNRTCNSPDLHLSYWEYDSQDDLDNMVKPKSSSDCTFQETTACTSWKIILTDDGINSGCFKGGCAGGAPPRPGSQS